MDNIDRNDWLDALADRDEDREFACENCHDHGCLYCDVDVREAYAAEMAHDANLERQELEDFEQADEYFTGGCSDDGGW